MLRCRLPEAGASGVRRWRYEPERFDQLERCKPPARPRAGFAGLEFQHRARRGGGAGGRKRQRQEHAAAVDAEASRSHAGQRVSSRFEAPSLRFSKALDAAHFGAFKRRTRCLAQRG